MFKYLNLLYKVLLFSAFQCSFFLFANAEKINPETLFSSSKTNSKTCDGNAFNEASLFLNDYLDCIDGHKENCNSIFNYLQLGGKIAATASNLRATHYYGSRILSMAATSLLDAKRSAKDGNYKKDLVRDMGGTEIDKIVKEFKGDEKAAFKNIETKLDTFDPKRLRRSGENPLDLKTIPEPQRERFIDLLSQENKLKTRIRIHTENSNLIANMISKTTEINLAATSNLKEIDYKLVEFDEKIRSGHLNENQKMKIKKQISDLENLKLDQIEKMPRMQTELREIAEPFNSNIDELINSIKSDSKLSQSARAQETVNRLKKLKIKVKKEKLNTYSRIIISASEKGYSAVDITSQWSRLPDWAKEHRLSQFREMPVLVRKALSENPDLANNMDELIERIAYLEHERYREFTQKKLIGDYNADQGLKAYAKNIESKIASVMNGGDLNKYADNTTVISRIDPNKKVLNQAERELLTVLKPNWLDVDVPYKDTTTGKYVLSSQHRKWVDDSAASFFRDKFPSSLSRKRLTPLENRVLMSPYLGKFAGNALKAGFGWGTAGAMLWYDWYDYRELGYNLTFFVSDKARDYLSDKIDPSCRMPDERKLGANDPYGKVSKPFCHCQTEETFFSKLPEACRLIPSLRDKETNKLCQLANVTGRDRDLYIAKAYSELSSSKQQYKDLLKSNVGCEVMKNQNSNCRFSTEDITSQGLYYLNIIQHENLFKPVAELCPDVCNHWVSIARNKAAEILGLNRIKLPSRREENTAQIDCDNSFLIKDPPTYKNSNMKWRACQKPIVCKSMDHIRVNISPRSRYEIDLNKYTLKPTRVTHYFFHDLGTSEKYDDFEMDHPLSPKVYSLRNYAYSFDQDGKIASLIKYNRNLSNQVDESYAKVEFEDALGADAYNTISNGKGLKLEQHSTAKRLEMFLMVNHAINYCCENDLKNECESATEVESPFEKLMEINGGEK